jgi:hypothetical protein
MVALGELLGVELRSVMAAKSHQEFKRFNRHVSRLVFSLGRRKTHCLWPLVFL